LAGAAFLAGLTGAALLAGLTALLAGFFAATSGIPRCFPCDGKARCYTLPRAARQLEPTPPPPQRPGALDPFRDRSVSPSAAAWLQALDQPLPWNALSVRPIVLGICHGGDRPLWSAERYLAGTPPHRPLSSTASWRP
jgi:hypothetical protein